MWISRNNTTFIRADESPVCSGPYKDGSWTWKDTPCLQCSSFDGYDVCRNRNHFGSVTDQVLNMCYQRRVASGEIVDPPTQTEQKETKKSNKKPRRRI